MGANVEKNEQNKSTFYGNLINFYDQIFQDRSVTAF